MDRIQQALINNEHGYQLIEVMISIVVIAIALLALLGAFQQGLTADWESGQASTAVNIGQQTIEELKSVPPARIGNLASTDDIVGPNGEQFRRTVVAAPNETDSSLLDVEVTITWKEQQRELAVHLYTQFLLAPFSNYPLHPERV